MDQTKMSAIELRWTGASGAQAKIDSQESSVMNLMALAGNNLLRGDASGG